jgi:hypothetical protein
LWEAEELKSISQTEHHHNQMPGEGWGQEGTPLRCRKSFASAANRTETSWPVGGNPLSVQEWYDYVWPS